MNKNVCTAVVAALTVLTFATALPTAHTSSSKEDNGEEELMQLEAYQPPESYLGCYLGWFWCTRLQQAGVTSDEASRLSYAPETDFDEWFYDGKPTCVARGVDWAPCDETEQALYCPGKSILDGLVTTSTYGTGEAQAEAVLEAIRNNGTHPNCPGCTKGRKVAVSKSLPCHTLKGQVCPFQCKEGYIAVGTHYCHENGTLTGGKCDPIPVRPGVQAPTPTPLPTPVPTPKPVTPVDVAHENWTAYAEERAMINTREFKDQIRGDGCYYLFQLAEYLNDCGYASPRSPLRTHLFDAARAINCGWLHDEIRDVKPLFPPEVPLRGDHGPWPKLYRPIRIVVDGYGPLAVSLTNKNDVKKTEEAKGKDLYDALKSALFTKEEYTIVVPGETKPIDDDDVLVKSYPSIYDVLLRAHKGRQSLYLSRDTDINGKKIGHRHPISEEMWKGVDLHKGAIAP